MWLHLNHAVRTQRLPSARLRRFASIRRGILWRNRDPAALVRNSFPIDDADHSRTQRLSRAHVIKLCFSA